MRKVNFLFSEEISSASDSHFAVANDGGNEDRKTNAKIIQAQLFIKNNYILSKISKYKDKNKKIQMKIDKYEDKDKERKINIKIEMKIKIKIDKDKDNDKYEYPDR